MRPKPDRILESSLYVNDLHNSICFYQEIFGPDTNELLWWGWFCRFPPAWHAPRILYPTIYQLNTWPRFT